MISHDSCSSSLNIASSRLVKAYQAVARGGDGRVVVVVIGGGVCVCVCVCVHACVSFCARFGVYVIF